MTTPISKWSDNVDVSRIGRACRSAMAEKAGDDIDRGLALLKHLSGLGYAIHRDLGQVFPPFGDPQPRD